MKGRTEKREIEENKMGLKIDERKKKEKKTRVCKSL
jgi:hypothetical protein